MGLPAARHRTLACDPKGNRSIGACRMEHDELLSDRENRRSSLTSILPFQAKKWELGCKDSPNAQPQRAAVNEKADKR